MIGMHNLFSIGKLCILFFIFLFGGGEGLPSGLQPPTHFNLHRKHYTYIHAIMTIMYLYIFL